MYKFISLLIIGFSLAHSQVFQPSSARTLALGQTFSLSANDIDFYNNPVMIAELKNINTTILYAHQFEDD